jgi:hypothetical protein
MCNSRTVTPAELYIMVTGEEPETLPVDDTAETFRCAICGKESIQGFPVYDRANEENSLVGVNFADYPLLINQALDLCPPYRACQKCRVLFQGNRLRNSAGYFVWYSGEQDKGVLKLESSTKKLFLEKMLNPPSGMFFCAFNRAFAVKYPSSNPAHILHLAVVNYANTPCMRYIATAYGEQFLVDVNFLKAYIELIRETDTRLTYRDILEGLTKKQKELVDRLGGTGAVLKHVHTIHVVTKLI